MNELKKYNQLKIINLLTFIPMFRIAIDKQEIKTNN